MVIGDANRINLSTSSFERIIRESSLYVDKTRMIENFLNASSEVNLIARQRRMGKSLNMDMVRCFLTDKEDLRNLFKGLYIESSPAWEMAHSSPVFSFDFRRLTPRTMKRKLFNIVHGYMLEYCNINDLSPESKSYIECQDYSDPDGLYILTEAVYRATGKRSYILIDEYDKLLVDNRDKEGYEEIRDFEKAFLSAGLKGNPFLEKALVTGVMRVSKESMFSDLNNIEVFDVFRDATFTFDYGFTEEEVCALKQLRDFDIDELRDWYNGFTVNSNPIYNTYSVVSFLSKKELGCYWGMSGSMTMAADLINTDREMKLTGLLNGEQAEVPMADRISLQHLTANAGDEAFYSLLVQCGYLSLDGRVPNKVAEVYVSIPNKELREVWQRFILENIYSTAPRPSTIFDNAGDHKRFAKDIEYFLSERLSFHDLAVYDNSDREKTHERVYHVFLLGILSAYEDVRFKRALSNRESGDGRYDVLIEHTAANYIFEVKSCGADEDLDAKADEALKQIEVKRYGADLQGTGGKLVKIGVAVCGKRCRVRVC